MKSFLEWVRNLNESVSIYVHGHDYNTNINDLDDLSRHLQRKLIDPFWNKLTPEQQKNVIPHYEMLTPDGSYYTKGYEILNFYTKGLDEKLISTLIRGIKYYLDELKVKYGPFKTEKSGMYESDVVRIPILKWEKTKNNPPLLNLSNDNARVIFIDLLGLSRSNEGYFSISPTDLYRKIEELDKEKIDIHAREPFSSKSKGVNFYSGGLSSNDILQRLEQLKKIAKWAMNNHYDEIYVA